MAIGIQNPSPTEKNPESKIWDCLLLLKETLRDLSGIVIKKASAVTIMGRRADT